MNAPRGMDYVWDLNGDGSFGSGAFENGVRQIQNVKYGSDSDSPGTIHLSYADHRKRYKIGVKIKPKPSPEEPAPESLLTLRREIRVALDKYIGTPLKAGEDNEERQKEVLKVLEDLSLPVGLSAFAPDPGELEAPIAPEYTARYYDVRRRFLWSPLAPPDGRGRFQYKPMGRTNGQIWMDLRGGDDANQPVNTMVMAIGSSFYDRSPKQTQEDMRASANHEVTHVRQTQDAGNNVSPWGTLSRVLSVDDFSKFMEAEAHLTELLDSRLGWLHSARGGNQEDMARFVTFYPAAEGLSRRTSIREEARPFVGSLYKQVIHTFPEMAFREYGGAENYDYMVRGLK